MSSVYVGRSLETFFKLQKQTATSTLIHNKQRKSSLIPEPTDLHAFSDELHRPTTLMWDSA